MDEALSSDDTSDPDDEVTLAELAALRGGELSADEEARLRMRMANDPEVEKKLWALDNVHRLFEKPGQADELPAEMPYDVAARLQARIAEQALHRNESTFLEGLIETRHDEGHDGDGDGDGDGDEQSTDDPDHPRSPSDD